ncbi:MAG TPA: isochorismatase family protein [Candidatus Binataceae bacterium]
MKSESTIFYDVDTQRDFILPGGKLYVKGAERIVPALAEVTRLAREQNIRMVCSVDRHFPGDPELQRNGGKYPDHCMDGTEGQRKINETMPLNPLYIPNHPLGADEIEQALAHQGEIVFEKQEFDVFTGNRHARAILRLLLQPYTDIVIYGVYTEVCVDHAVTGLLGMGPKLHVVKDAIADIDMNAPAVLKRWQDAGVELLSLGELKEQILNT